MTTWKYYKSGQYQSWDGIQGDDVVIVEKLAMRPYYEVQCPLSIKNAGRYPDLASAKTCRVYDGFERGKDWTATGGRRLFCRIYRPHALTRHYNVSLPAGNIQP